MAQSHLAFGGVDVDINLARGALEIDHRQRMPSVHQTGLVPSSNGLKERACGYRALIDEDVNVIAFPSGDVRRADPSTPALFTGRFLVIWRKLEFNEFGGLCLSLIHI